MASTLVVLAANGRRANTKANPNTALSEVLQSACKSLRLNADQYALKSVCRCFFLFSVFFFGSYTFARSHHLLYFLLNFQKNKELKYMIKTKNRENKSFGQIM